MKKIAVIFCAAVLCAVIAAFALCAEAMHVPVFAVTEPMCVVLDAGHGGIDGGVTGKKTGVKESTLNLSVTMKLKSLLEDAGFNVVLTRRTEAGLYGVATRGFKKRDMQKRKEIIERAKPVAMISVHQNFYSSRTSRGGQVFYKQGSESGKQLAEAIQERFNGLYAPLGVNSRTAATGDYFMLKCTEFTSVIAECGFLSNPSDEALLITSAFQKRVAESICAGFLAYFSSAAGA